MPLSVTHPFVSAIADGGDATLVQPSNWNAAHTLTGVASAAQGGTGVAYFAVAGPTAERIYTFPDSAATILYSGGPLGTPSSGTLTNATGLPYTGLANGTAGNLITWSAAGVADVVATGTATHVLTSNGAGAAPTFQAPAAASVTLDGITAATADQAGISNGDFNIVWNWQKTTNSEVAFTIGESAASTGGTANNQVLFRVATAAASTAVPFQVFARGAASQWVNPAGTSFVVAAAGSATACPYGIAGAVNTGIFSPNGTDVAVSHSGTEIWRTGSTGFRINDGLGTTANPNIADVNSATSGLNIGGSALTISVAGVENTRWTAGVSQFSKGTADAVSYAMNFRKSRGSVASPTVITTADDLATISGFGYVGSTNTYQEACRITFDSTGTISDSTTGIGGITRFLCAKVGAEPAEILRLTAGTTTGGGWATLNEADANPGTGDLADGDEVAVYFKAGNIVFAQNVGGTINFLYCPVDGTTVLFTANTTGP